MLQSNYVFAKHGFNAEDAARILIAHRQYIAQKKPFLHNGTHAKVCVEAVGDLLMATKSYGTLRPFTLETGRHVLADYHQAYDDFLTLGIRAVAHSFDIALQKPSQGHPTITLQQLFFPLGTAEDYFMGNDVRYTQAILRQIITSVLLPILQANSKRPAMQDWESIVAIDSGVNNFAILPAYNTDNLKVFYFDFFVPRVRLADGNVKTYWGQVLHKISEAEARYRFFTKPGILHNFLRKSVPLLQDKIREECVDLIHELLGETLQEFFPGTRVQALAQRAFTDTGYYQHQAQHVIDSFHAAHRMTPERTMHLPF